MIKSEIKFTEDEVKILLNLLNDELESQQQIVLEIQELKKYYRESGIKQGKDRDQLHELMRRKAENQIQIIWNTCKKIQDLKQS